MFPKCAPVLGVLLGMTGCVITEHAGPTEHDFRAIDRDASETVRAHFKMGAGNLRIGSGTEKLMRADFDYNVPSWKPEVQYNAGVLRISQPEGNSTHFGNTQIRMGCAAEPRCGARPGHQLRRGRGAAGSRAVSRCGGWMCIWASGACRWTCGAARSAATT